MTTNQSPPAQPDGDALQDREAFCRAHHPTLDLTEVSDSWGRPMFKHPHVESMWQGWRDARVALRATSPAHDAAGGADWQAVPQEPTQEMVRAAYREQPDTINAGFAQAYRAMIAAAPAPPKPAPDAVRSPADAFDLGFAWAMGLHGQNVEDSRAVGRTLQGYLFDGLNIDLSGFDSFKPGDEGIVEAKRRIKAALSSPSVTEPPERELHGSSMPPDRPSNRTTFYSILTKYYPKDATMDTAWQELKEAGVAP